jgi:hypothetical protein
MATEELNCFERCSPIQWEEESGAKKTPDRRDPKETEELAELRRRRTEEDQKRQKS